jgi:hypothetical protein
MEPHPTRCLGGVSQVRLPSQFLMREEVLIKGTNHEKRKTFIIFLWLLQHFSSSFFVKVKCSKRNTIKSEYALEVLAEFHSVIFGNNSVGIEADFMASYHNTIGQCYQYWQRNKFL